MNIKQKLLSALLVGTLLTPLTTQLAFAGSGVIYISPGASSLQDGNSETLSLRINPGATVDGVQATVSLDSSLLRLNSVDTSASPFSAQLQKTVSGSGFTVALGNLSGGVSSDSLIATFNVTALVPSGTATLAISNANATSSGSYTNPSISNASIGFTSPPAPAPTPTPVISAKSPTSGTSIKSTAAIATPTPPTTPAVPISPLVAPHLMTKISPEYSFATLSVRSDQNLNIYALYGTAPDSLTVRTNVASQTMTASLKLGNQTPLTPGTTYYYQVVAEATDGTQTKMSVQHFMTNGYTVSVTVLGKNNQPLIHQKVSLHSVVQTVKTDGNGVATFTNVTPGEHHLTYTDGNQTYSAVAYVDSTPVAGSVIPATQNIAVIFPVAVSAKHSTTIFMSTAAVLVIGFAALYFLNPSYATKVRHLLAPRKQVPSSS